MKGLPYFTFLFGLFGLILAACVPVASAGGILTPVQSPAPQITPTQVSGPEMHTRIFSSDLYHYQVSYPAGWTIQINTTAPSGEGTNPEYVTLTVNDPSNLPRIDIEVLTDAPPMTGFENCDHNFVFRNIPACKISRPAGQNPASELWIFQNGAAHFFIGMQYQGEEPVQIFADFLSSFEFTESTPTALPQPTKGG
jgi:hypothetical protein